MCRVSHFISLTVASRVRVGERGSTAYLGRDGVRYRGDRKLSTFPNDVDTRVELVEVVSECPVFCMLCCERKGHPR